MGDPRSASWMSCSSDTERVQILLVFMLRMRRRWQWFSGVRSASPREVFKLTKLWRNYHEVAELRKRQSPAALREEVVRALQMKSIAHARKIMETNAEVDFVLDGPSGEDHDGQPMLVLEKPLSCAEAGKLVAAVAAAREAVLSGKIQAQIDQDWTSDNPSGHLAAPGARRRRCAGHPERAAGARDPSRGARAPALQSGWCVVVVVVMVVVGRPRRFGRCGVGKSV